MDEVKEININGYDTYYSEKTDKHGSFLLIAIPKNAGHDISDICGKFICNHIVKEVGYCDLNGNKFIKAYY